MHDAYGLAVCGLGALGNVRRVLRGLAREEKLLRAPDAQLADEHRQCLAAEEREECSGGSRKAARTLRVSGSSASTARAVAVGVDTNAFAAGDVRLR